MMILSGTESADFLFLRTALSLTNGNLSRHIEKLELAGYVKVKKAFRGRMPYTTYQLTKAGAKALTRYWKELDVIRQTGRM